MGGLTMLYVSTSVPKCQVGHKQLACHGHLVPALPPGWQRICCSGTTG